MKEVCPQRDEEIALAIQGHTANQVAERGAEDKRQRETRGRKDDVAQLSPQRMLHMRPQFKRQSTEHEQPQDKDQREVETAEPGRVGLGKREEQYPGCSDQPDFVPVPHRADRVVHRLAVCLTSPKEWIEDSYAEIKAVEHHVEAQHQRHCCVPKGLHDQYPWPSFPSTASLPAFRTSGIGPSRMA